MAQKTKQILKSYFETGDIPTQGNYVNLIDSNLNLNETGTQILVGTLSSSFLEVENHITASGNISSSGTVYANQYYSDGHPIVKNQLSGIGNIAYLGFSNTTDGIQIGKANQSKGINITGHITASSNISASGDILAANLILKDGASNSFGNIHVNTTGYSNGIYTNNTGSFIADPTQIYVGAANPGPSQINFATQDHPNTLKIFKGNITASGNISASGTIIAPTINATNYFDSTSTYHLLTVDGTTLRIGQDSITSNISAVPLNVLGHITASGNISASNLNVNRVTIEADPDNSYQTQLDMTSTADSIINLYQNETLTTSFHSRGNINSFIEAGNSIANLGVGTSTPTEKLTVHGNISGSGNLQIDGSQVDFTNLPTSDPGVAGRLYNDSGTVKISL